MHRCWHVHALSSLTRCLPPLEVCVPPALVLVVAAVVAVVVVVVIVVEQSTLLPHRAAAGSVAGSVAGSSTAATGSGSPLAAQPPSARQVLDAKPVAALEAAARRPRPRGRTCTRRRPVEAVATASPPGDHETLLVTRAVEADDRPRQSADDSAVMPA